MISLLVVAPLLAARAEEEPDAGPAWIEAVVAAAPDPERLRTLAAQPRGDPWRAVDALHARGEGEAAAIFARALPKDVDASLARYAARDPSADAAVREALGAVRDLARAGKLDAAWTRAQQVGDVEPSVPALQFQRLCAKVATARKDVPARLEALGEAAAVGHALGWARATVGVERARFLEAVSRPDAGDLARAAAAGFVRAAARTPRAEDDVEGLVYHGGLLVEGGRLRAGADALREALRRMEKLAGYGDAAQAHATLAVACVMMGEPALGLRHSEAAVRLYSEREFVPGVLYARSVAIAAYSDLGLDAEVLDLGARQIEEAQGVDTEAVATAELAVAIAEARRGQAAEAARRFARVIARRERAGGGDPLALALLNRGLELHLARGDAKAARDDFERALALEGASPRHQAYARLHQGDALAALGEGPAAERTYREAVGSAVADHVLLGLARTGLAERLFARGDARGARREAAAAVAALTGQVAQLGAAESLALLGRRGSLRARDVLLRASDALAGPAAIFEAVESSRALALLHNLGGGARLRQVGVSQDVQAADAAARLALKDARLAYARARRRTRRLGPLQRAGDAVKAAERAAELARARLQRQLNALARAARPRPASLRELQSWLLPDEAYVAYYLSGDTLVSLLVTRTNAARHVLGAWSHVRDLAVGTDGLRRKDRPMALDAGGVPRPIAELATALLGKGRLPANVRRLVVAPVPELANVPWPLIARAIGREAALPVPSASMLLALDHAAFDPAAPRLAVGVSRYALPDDAARRLYVPGGDALGDLPSAHDEALAVATREADVKLTKTHATEEALYEALTDAEGGWSVIHFACHGLLHRRRPELSALALLPGGGTDGFVTGAELLSAPLRAGLAVLSACDVGTQRATPGEGYAGVPSALLAAGAQRVLANLWRVSDEAGPVFMARFYAELAKDRRPAAALARTQAAFPRVHPNWRHPYYWAGWVLWGSPR